MPTFTLKVNLFSSAVTLKIKTRSLKHYQICIEPKWCTHPNLVLIHLLAHLAHKRVNAHVVRTKNMPPPISLET